MGDARTSPRVAFETARLRLARYRVEGHEARGRAAAHATQVSAEALEVERVGVWMLSDRARRLSCTTAYSRSLRKHASGQVLQVSPAYATALAERRAIAITDAANDERTHDLAPGYLTQLNISSLLDAAIFREGRVVGIVRHEHVGAKRTWTQRDLDFAVSVADMITTIFEQADRLELEAALQQQAEHRQESQKMEALGRVACAVAHDFNNVLSALILSTDAALAAIDPAMAEDAREMVAVGQRLTQQLLTFGKPRSDSPYMASDVHAVLTSMRPMLQTSVGVSIQLHVELLSTGRRVVLDQSQVEQIVLNLCLNARDALPRGGAITVTVRDARPDDEISPERLILEVSDTGLGMDEATLSRIFEPYFTTKASGGGLGLATVHGIVRRARGIVRASSQPGQGTTILVALPVAPEL